MRLNFTLLAPLFLCLLLGELASAQPAFPALTGRVVDQANILAADTRNQLSALLAEHEQNTSNQVVVVTIPTLEGYDIADYGYQLGRHWQIGQQDKNNGVLLIVALAERKIRIEVGYGLEGALTDALSSQIIRREIQPAFKQSDFNGGVIDGVRAILGAIAGEYTLDERSNVESIIEKIIPFVLFGAIGGQILVRQIFGRNKTSSKKARLIAAVIVGFVIAIIVAVVLSSIVAAVYALIGASGLSYFFLGNKNRHNGNRYRDGTSNRHHRSSGGGGFSGGGGSFGGGGASGSW